MKGYLLIRQTAENGAYLNSVSTQYCSQERIPESEKFGYSGEIPANMQKPSDPRQHPSLKSTLSKEE